MQRLEGMSKLTGAERYVDDLPLDGALWGMTVRSPVARGRIVEVRFDPSFDWSECVVVDHRDIPGANEIALIENDQPVLAAGATRHVHEPVVLIAHPDRATVRRAVRAVEVVVEPAEPVFDMLAAVPPGEAQHGDDNVMKRLEIAKGDVEAALREAAHVIEGTYETGAQEHVYLEPNGMAAWLEAGPNGDVVVVTGSMQCPYYVVSALAHALDRDPSQLRVVHAPTGGGFGGKEDYPSVLAVHASLLALKSGRPVKMIYDRGEDMAATTKRHPAIIRHRTGADGEGRLLAQDIEVILDGGAYVTLSPVVLSRGIIHAAGPYSCDHVRIRGRAMLTNRVPFGAFRGFGAPQTQFANERHMDIVARQLDIDPFELRRRNLIADGQTTSTGQVIRDGADRQLVLDTAIRETGVASKRRAHAAFNARERWRRRGLGLATFYHGAGFTGAGEVHLASRLAVHGLADGRVEVLAANTEMGQGATTVLTQIAAERIGYPPSDIVIAAPDTSRVPDSGPTVASRTAMVVGRLVERACDELRRRVGLDDGARGSTVREAIERWHAQHPGETLAAEAKYEPPPGVAWDEQTYTGDAYGAFAWAAYVAEVEVDLRTFGMRVIDFVAVQEIGRVLNHTLATGQIAGGVVQGIGWALMEDVVWRDGAMANGQLTNYIIATSDDVPPIRVHFLEQPYPDGAGGAKGIGELPIDGPAPAVINAVADALSAELVAEPTVIPLTPERLMPLLLETGAPA